MACTFAHGVGMVFAPNVLVKWFENSSQLSSEHTVVRGPGMDDIMQTVGVIPGEDLLLFGN